MIINVKVKPNSSKNEIEAISDHTFKIKVTSPPERGKANDAVIKLLSKHFKTAKSNIGIITGKRASEKIIEVNI
jgi:uncharacterized protein